ncbi:hypothetical protein SARC_13617, partial [Sphaeroforma arctica JP610]
VPKPPAKRVKLLDISTHRSTHQNIRDKGNRFTTKTQHEENTPSENIKPSENENKSEVFHEEQITSDDTNTVASRVRE